MGNQKFTIISARSSIDWVGRRLFGAHNGTIAIKEGELLLNEDRLTGRTKYGMKFRSGDFVRDVGSTLIHNDFELSIIVIAKATIL
jgi:hypothetical protein